MKKVLLVDDSGTIVMSLSDVLRRQGFEVKTAGDGTEGLSTVTGGFKPDLVITDLHMPKMDGIELIKALRTQGGLRFTPILVLTTESQQAKRDEAKKAGATGWLVKPVTAEKLTQVVKQVLPGA